MAFYKLSGHIKSLLSIRQKAFLRFMLDLAKEPLKIKSHLNYFSYIWELLRKDKINYTPPVFVATITENCNLRCPTCLYLLEDSDKFSKRFITVDKFRYVLERYNAKKLAKIIFLSGGEPLLHPQLDKLVDICKDYGLMLKTSTNGILIKKHINLLKKFDYINVSLDAHDYESFKINRGGTPEQFDSIIHGLNFLKENGVYFSMSFLLSTQNMADANAMLAVAEKIGPNFVYFHNINPHGNASIRPLTIHDKDTIFFLKNLVYKTDYPFDINMGVVFDTESVTFNQGKCIQPWYYFCFNSAGEVAYCCHLAHNKQIGNVFEGYDLNSLKMTSFRKNIIRGKFPKSCLYCQRRFMGKEYAAFSAKDQEWAILRKV